VSGSGAFEFLSKKKWKRKTCEGDGALFEGGEGRELKGKIAGKVLVDEILVKTRKQSKIPGTEGGEWGLDGVR